MTIHSLPAVEASRITAYLRCDPRTPYLLTLVVHSCIALFTAVLMTEEPATGVLKIIVPLGVAAMFTTLIVILMMGVPIDRVGQFTHCLDQMERFANAASDGGSFNALQFGLNLGRAQELAGATTSVDDWWRVYKPLVETSHWAEIVRQVERYREQVLSR